MKSRTEQVHRQANRYLEHLKTMLTPALGPRSAGLDPKILKAKTKQAAVTRDKIVPRPYADG